MKKSILYISIFSTLFLSACNSSSTATSNNNPAAWHNDNSPFVMEDDGEINDNQNLSNTLSGLDNGQTLYLFNDNGTIWYNNEDEDIWHEITLPVALSGEGADFRSFNISPDGETVLGLTTNNKMLYFDGVAWSDTQLNSCMTSVNQILATAVNLSFNVITILNSDGVICQYDTQAKKWSKNTIPATSNNSQIWVSNLASAGNLMLLNGASSSIYKFSSLNESGQLINGNFNSSDSLEPAGDIFMTDSSGTKTVVFSNSKNDFYYYNGDSWEDTTLDVAAYAAEYVEEKGYFFDDSNNPYIFAALNNNTILAFYQGKWQNTPISIPENQVINQFVTNISGSSMYLLISYTDINITDTSVEHDILYNLSDNSVVDLNVGMPAANLVFSTDLDTIYAVTGDQLIYQYDSETQKWENTNFNIADYSGATYIGSANATNDGALNLVLSNGQIITYHD